MTQCYRLLRMRRLLLVVLDTHHVMMSMRTTYADHVLLLYCVHLHTGVHLLHRAGTSQAGLLGLITLALRACCGWTALVRHSLE